MEKEYILRIQNHYETYYKEVFSTQTHILWTIGLTATLISITLMAVFFVAGRFGFNIFDRKIDSALKDATTQLRTEFAERLANETNALQEAHASELKALEHDLTKRIAQQELELKIRSRYQFDFAQGLAAGADGRRADARATFRRALRNYKLGKARQLIPKRSGATTVRNIFIQFLIEDKANFVENTGKELADELYNDLEDELALAAVLLTALGPVLKERQATPSQQSMRKPKTEEAEPSAPD
jgi:hypothetical protein